MQSESMCLELGYLSVTSSSDIHLPSHLPSTLMPGLNATSLTTQIKRPELEDAPRRVDPSSIMTAQEVGARYPQSYIQFSSITLLYYDYTLTLGMEVKYIWSQKFRLSTLLYIFARYALVANVIFILAKSDKLGSSCDSWYQFLAFVSVLGRGAVIFTLAARAYALFGRNRYILVYFIVTGGTCLSLAAIHIPGNRCAAEPGIPMVNHFIGVTMLVVEYSSVLTCIRSVQAFRVSGGLNSSNKGFIHLVFEQGLLYFLFVSFLTLASTILNFRAPNWFLQRLLNALVLPMSGLVTARFLLHLRAWEHKQSAKATCLETSGELQFRRSGVAARLTDLDDFGDDPVETARRLSIEAFESSSDLTV